MGRGPDYGLDYENSLLNMMAGCAILIFIIILCIAVSRRSRKSGRSSSESLEGLYFSGIICILFYYLDTISIRVVHEDSCIRSLFLINLS